MTVNLKKLIKCVAIPLLVGALSALLTKDNYNIPNQPPLSPPAWVFPVVWTVLYTLMGIASYIICASNFTREEKNNALTPYVLQLVLNFFWSIIFFNMRQYLFAFVWIIALWVLILITIARFRKISVTASNLLIPYIIWVSFAAYLNLAIYLIN